MKLILRLTVAAELLIEKFRVNNKVSGFYS
jgi:hypothetical protein